MTAMDRLLAQCASEPIHLLGRTQRFGVLVAFDRARRIVFISGNAAAWCGRPPAHWLGRPATDLLPLQAVQAAFAHARVAQDHQQPQRLYGVAWPGRSEPVDVSIHASGELVVVEAEPGGPPASDPALALEAATRELAACRTLPALAQSAARVVARLTGHDRVMVYRFAADGSGTVIAEHLAPGQASYMGLRYPAADIPVQARRLYLRNPTRVIADALDDGLPLAGLDAQPPDLSLAALRSVSPVHLQYMRNMGTRASMSISLVIDGELWGLIACHHRQPLCPPLACRTMSELLGRLYALAIARIGRTGLDDDIRDLLLGPPGVDPLVDDTAPPAAREAACRSVLKLLGVSGYVSRIGSDLHTQGQAPNAAQTAEILAALPPTDHPKVQAVESLTAMAPRLARLAPGVAGVLALPLGAGGTDWVLLLRDEVRRHVHWAGNPDKVVDQRDGRLSPRSSFAAWLAEVRLHCEPWTAGELALADVLRRRLLDVLLAHREQRQLEVARRAATQQALLVRELNHRVRNMLGLIKGLVQQTAARATTVEDLAQRLHDRVQALSRAYAQVEKTRWQPTPLAALLDDETRAFSEPGQVRLEGDPVCLEPGAYLAFALVLHELATNARKHGALSVPGGRLHVRWQVLPDRGLQLDWTESGGPPVRAPTERGFGTRVIGQALAHQLRGSATLDFRPEGLHARLGAPRGYVAGNGSPDHAPAQRAGRRRRRAPTCALVVEDDLVIALMAETMLQQQGCRRVLVAGSEAAALDILRAQRVDFALLDVNLGDHTSEGVARRLRDLGVPVVVATGYSETDVVPAALRGLPRIAKPYTEPDLAQAVATATA